jgi:hypothetical protein
MDDNARDKPKFTFFVNNNEFTTHEHELTGSAIKTIAGIPPDYELFEVKPNDKTDPIGDATKVRIHTGLHFRAIPAGTFGE